MVRASSPSPRPDARTYSSLPSLEEFDRTANLRKLRWSPLRKQILALLWTTCRAWGVYGIAERLSAGGSLNHPISVHRAVKSLERAKLILPIVTWSRFVISPDPNVESWAIILCSTCKRFSVVAVPEEGRTLRTLARSQDFRPERAVVECLATCGDCVRDQVA